MTGKERLLTALKRGIPDRIPTMEWDIYPGIYRALTGQDDSCRFIEELDIDGIAIWQDRRITPINDKIFKDEFGVIRAYSDEYPSAVGFPVSTPSDLKNFQMPSPDDDAIYVTLRKALASVSQERLVVGRVRDVFSFPRDTLGFENFLAGFYEEPALVDELMCMSIEYSTAVMRNMRSLGVEVIACLDDIADGRGTLISPDMYRAQILPRFCEIVNAAHENGLLIVKHTDGDLHDILDDLVGSGIDCLDPIDPMGHMDIGDIKAKYGDRIALKGNVNCADVLVTGTLEDVEAAVLDCLAKGKPGGYILSSSNSIHKSVNPENYRYMLDCLKKYGWN